MRRLPHLRGRPGPEGRPDLYGVVGREVASKAGLQLLRGPEGARAATGRFDELNKWLNDPRADVPGTAMTFAGMSNEKQRAD